MSPSMRERIAAHLAYFDGEVLTDFSPRMQDSYREKADAIIALVTSDEAVLVVRDAIECCTGYANPDIARGALNELFGIEP